MLELIRLRERDEPFAVLIAKRFEEIYESTDDAYVKSELMYLAKEFDDSLSLEIVDYEELESAYNRGHDDGYSEGYDDGIDGADCDCDCE